MEDGAKEGCRKGRVMTAAYRINLGEITHKWGDDSDSHVIQQGEDSTVIHVTSSVPVLCLS